MTPRKHTRQLVVHCSATTPEQNIGVVEIRRWHTDPPPKGRGWSDVGYHYVIRRSGRLEKGRAEDLAGAHVRGHNYDTVGICLVGGVDGQDEPQQNFTVDQFATLLKLLVTLKKRYPTAHIRGHRDFPGVDKACPCFNTHAWWNGAINP